MLRLLLSTSLICALLGCAPTMIDHEGHRVFNPRYLWALESEKRERWQQPDRVLETLALPEAAAVADIGAGGGYFTERFARWVGPKGRVYATDVQDAMLTRLRERVAERGLANVEVISAEFDDPTLPDACCDLVLFSSVYKEIDGRVDYMRKLRQALREGGRVAILEFRPRTFGAGPPRDVRLPPEQVANELAEAGFALVESHDFLPREYFLVFAPATAAGQPEHEAAEPILSPIAGAAGAESAQPEYDRTGWYLGLAGFYAISDYDLTTSDLDVVPPQPPNTDPHFGNSGGVDFRAGYRAFSRWAFEFDYQWQAGYDSKRSIIDPLLEIDTHLLSLNAKFFVLTGRWQPYALLGASLLIVNTEIVDSAFKKPWDISVGFAPRFAAGVDFWINEDWAAALEGTYIVPVGALDGANMGSVGAGFQYRF